ncbi:DHH family phosphoesterase [Halobellus inordinatus]|uniref:DHH family phosphoesterase n=1 Tax=Halobellus inordinatus TaxID=1126236 RepID=UPI00210A29FF|nr:bifunctional oligoribonuclease/PAP phosphatase NrnA [Halobellus inordinatus]
MQRRLVLGCGSAVRGTIERLAEWPGELVILSQRGDVVDAIGADGVTTKRRAPADAEAFPDRAELVFVASDDAAANAEAAAEAREQFPDAQLVVYLSAGATAQVRERILETADRVIDAEQILLDRVRELTTAPGAERIHRLFATLRRIDGRLAVVMHDNPDPDAIASALALARIAASVDVPADACYFGDISHQENRALVNLLDLALVELDDGTDLAEYDGVALVDHSRPGVNDGLPGDTEIDIVVDHHPPRAPVEAHFVDLRRDIGATSTLLAEYLRRAGIEPEESLATSLLFGIRVDTNDFAREVSPADFEAAAWLLTYADLSMLDRVESPSMTSAVLETLGRAIHNRDVRGDALASNVGAISDRDALAQAADRLLNMEGIRIAIVYGFRDGTVYVSGRARGTDVDLGETLRDALGAIGSAGGHADMAGAQVPLGILADADDESIEELSEVVTEVIASRVFETLEDATTLLDVGADDTEWAFEFPFEVDEE